MVDSHLTAKELNLFLENRCTESEAKKIAGHLRACKECLAAYTDAARNLGLWEADPAAFEAAPELIRMGEELAAGRAPGRSVRRRGGVGFLRWRMILTGVAPALTVAVVGFWLLSHGLFRDNIRLEAGVTGPVKAAIEIMSAQGPLVIPGGEDGLDDTPQVYRSAFAAHSDSLSGSLDYLLHVYQNGETGRDVSYWLVAGLLASGQLDAAHDYGRQAMLEHPEDDAIVTLVALVAYSSGDFAESKRLLDRVLQRAPGDPVASINLALVLAEQGETKKAMGILEGIRDAHRGTPIGDRAESLLLENER